MLVLMQRPMNEILQIVADLVPAAYQKRSEPYASTTPEELISSASKTSGSSAMATGGHVGSNVSIFQHLPFTLPKPHCPRLVVTGVAGRDMGQAMFFAPAVLNALEKYPVYALHLPTIYTDSGSRTAEEACVQIFREARRNTPAILYLPEVRRHSCKEFLNQQHTFAQGPFFDSLL